jgi:diguanylate cyclase (GGDEF)-like protein/PAS domain S-box-containing protein
MQNAWMDEERGRTFTGPEGDAQALPTPAMPAELRALNSAFATLTLDAQGRVLRANNHFLDAWGYRLDELEGRDLLDISPEDGLSGNPSSLWRDVLRGERRVVERMRLHKDGDTHWVQAFYTPLADADGVVRQVVEISNDISSRVLKAADDRGQIQAINVSQAVVEFALDGTVLDANARFLEAMGYRLDEVAGRHHRMFVDAAYAGSAEYAGFWAALASGRHHAAEYRRLGKGGRDVWLQATYNPIFDPTGRVRKVVKYATDITQEKLRQADFQSQIVAINKSQGVITFAVDGTILDANPNFLATFGYTLEEMVGRHHRMLLEPGVAETPEYKEFWRTLREGKFVAGRHKRIGKDGRELWLQASYNPVYDLGGKLTRIIKFASDVTSDVALAQAFEDAQRQAQHDAATSLPNRTRLSAFMASALTHPKARLALLYLDLDRFKPINDTYGHPVGDKVLGEIADRLRRSLKADQLAARIGGDEFVIAAPNLTDEELDAYCQHLLQAIAAPIRSDVGDLEVGVSIGVAVSPADGSTPDELLRAADTALYRSKHNGRGTYCFFANEMNDRVTASRRMIEEMRRGIAAGEFYLDFQPRFDARTQSIRSAEALVRWAHPQRGRIGPDDFIPLAEKSGLILPLGDWVLQTACEAAVQWPDIGVSVNVSPVQFRDGRLVQRVKEVLSGAGLAPERLEIEITEGVLMDDAEGASVVLRELKDLGVQLAIDDFGTGYASLSSLRSFPFDVIKIDRQFIADIEQRDGSRDVVKAILALGKALGLSVTAEGVETDGQLQTLIEDHCAEVQGFLLGRPMTAPKLIEMVEDVR